MKRRDFLKSGLFLGAGASVFSGLGIPGQLAFANSGPADDEYYTIFCYFNGGWDILLSLDPRDPGVFTAGAIQTTGIYPGYELLEGSDGQLLEGPGGSIFGPYAGELLPWLNDMTIIRGMSMETLTHVAGMRRFLTGRPPSGLQARGSSIGTWLAAAKGESQIIPNLCLGVESYNVDQPNFATGMTVNSVQDLIRALERGQPELSSEEWAQLDGLLSQFAACDASQKSPFVQTSTYSRTRAKDMVDAEYSGLFQFMNSNDPKMEEIRDLFGIQGNTALQSSAAQGAAAVIALTSGLSRVASVRVAGALDTHFEDNWTADQGPNQADGFRIVSAMLTLLKNTPYKETGESWLDRTTVVGFSEFSRTPLLNGNGGRDHSLTNACFLAGGRVKGGQILGRSSDVGMVPLPVNLATGEMDPGGVVIRPEHIHAALLAKEGLTDDQTDLRVDPYTAILKG